MTDPKTTELLQRVVAGDAAARDQLFERHRQRLTRMVAMRLDPRATRRFDPSDVVQESLVLANERLESYAKERRLPFYSWLRGIAWEQLLKFHRRHVTAQKRSVDREVTGKTIPLSDASVDELVNIIVGQGDSPSQCLMKMETKIKIRNALDALRSRDREIIELRYMEQLDNSEIAAVLNIAVSTVRTRHCRAIQRLHAVLEESVEE